MNLIYCRQQTSNSNRESPILIPFSTFMKFSYVSPPPPLMYTIARGRIVVPKQNTFQVNSWVANASALVKPALSGTTGDRGVC
ncbi:Hypothetical protein NTJ_03203 [Nesidiocoris tenuis]|uniref:Uncharacterized protein n=1 Tax=Nesidiocoris tenuis TaxID=355587 RepID=A0ABN7ADM9_9HEMI|nr:Hypothetical protein NTJ_03203 [Nesidiocoris tenuis]